MNCPDEDVLSAYVDREANLRERVWVGFHAGRCARCAAAVKSLRALKAAAGRRDAPPMPEELRQNLRALTPPVFDEGRETSPSAKSRGRLWRTGRMILGLSALLAANIALWRRNGTAALIAACLTVVLLAGCGPNHDFRQAEFLDRTQRYPSAVLAFRRFADKYPADPRAPEALVRAAGIYIGVFARCEEAKPLLERAARQYQEREPWAARARRALLDCPEYFPLRDGSRLIYVDSQSGGKNMRLDLKVEASTDEARGTIVGAYFAGNRRVGGYERSYAKEDWAIWEIQGRDRVPILKYPYAPGTSWAGRRGGRPVEFTIESNRAVVRLRSGSYHDCLKVREGAPHAKAWKYDYYAPGTGWIRTTVGSARSESPNTELLREQARAYPKLNP